MSTQAVQLYESDASLVLANDRLQLHLSRRNRGALAALSSPRLPSGIICPDSPTGADLWRLAGEDAGAPASNRSAETFSHSFSQTTDGGVCLTMEWRVRVGGRAPFGVGVDVRLAPSSPLCTMRAWVDLPPGADWRRLRLDFPLLSGFPGALLDDCELALPLGQGITVRRPAGSLRSDAEWLYPGELSMQFAAISFGSAEMTLYLGAHDAGCAAKLLRALPGADGEFEVSLCQLGQPPRDGRIAWDSEVSLGLLDGGWQSAAAEYRRWAAQQPWQPGRTRRPSLRRLGDAPTDSDDPQHGVWLVGGGHGQQVVESALSLQRELNAPVRVLWQWWHGCPGEARYPDYLPPRDGDAELARVLALLKGAGIPAWLALDPSAASPRSSTWTAADLRSHAEVSPEGATRLVRSLASGDELAAMCRADPGWLSVLAGVCTRLTATGAAGAWLSSILPEGLGCFSTTHSHLPGARSRGDQLLAALGCAAVVSDPSEEWLAGARAVISRGSARERFGRPKGVIGDDWEPAPLLQSVYSPGLSAVGMIGPLDNTLPTDPLWPGARPVSDDSVLLRLDFSLQLGIEAARTLLWGEQIGLMHMDPRWLREVAHLRMLAFVRMLVQVNGTAPPASRGQYLGMVRCSCDPIDARFLVDSPARGGDGRHVFVKRVPAVLGAAWQGGGIGSGLLILVNVTDSAAEFVCTLPDALGDARSSVSGVTFSPTTGIRPAALAAHGAEITGHLPGHSACVLRL